MRFLVKRRTECNTHRMYTNCVARVRNIHWRTLFTCRIMDDIGAKSKTNDIPDGHGHSGWSRGIVLMFFFGLRGLTL